ncbi:MAG: Obg family GTPase, partial [bacterium]
PKIADYPFTTLHPNLGVVRYATGKSFVMADIPGLIEGASQGAGIGDRFLGHVERCACLLHLIDGGEEDVAHIYQTIRKELAAYSPDLAARPEIVALNKVDILSEEQIEEKRTALKAVTQAPVVAISGVTHRNVQPLLGQLMTLITDTRHREENQNTEEDVWVP